MSTAVEEMLGFLSGESSGRRSVNAPAREASLAWLAGLLHDIGKRDPEFQRRILGADSLDSILGRLEVVREQLGILARELHGDETSEQDRKGNIKAILRDASVDQLELMARQGGFELGEAVETVLEVLRDTAMTAEWSVLESRILGRVIDKQADEIDIAQARSRSLIEELVDG